MITNPDRFWTLLKPLYSQAEAFARYMAPRNWEDVLQESLLKALQALDSLNDEASFKFWLFRIIANETKRGARREFWKRFLPMELEHGETRELASDPDPALRLDLQHLKTAILRQPSVRRETLLLYHVAGLSVAEIADLRKESQGAIKSRLSRCRQELRVALDGGTSLSVIRGKTVKELDHDIEQCIQQARAD